MKRKKGVAFRKAQASLSSLGEHKQEAASEKRTDAGVGACRVSLSNGVSLQNGNAPQAANVRSVKPRSRKTVKSKIKKTVQSRSASAKGTSERLPDSALYSDVQDIAGHSIQRSSEVPIAMKEARAHNHAEATPKKASKFKSKLRRKDANKFKAGTTPPLASSSNGSRVVPPEATSTTQDGSAGVRSATQKEIPKTSDCILPMPDLVAARAVVADLMFRGGGVCETLLRARADLGPPAVLGPVMAHCAGRGLENCIKLLLERKASPDSRALYMGGGPGAAVTGAVRLSPHTAVQLAAKNGHVGVCRILVSAGASSAGVLESLEQLRAYGNLFAREVADLENLLSK
eukprot:TRINITY_DN61845_c0_g1_i1.p1 TRINITY_DN61845_c0_g1~~TRINITY_DN61845_c0_g1_i1.p1  ORF type:complete len:345 (-),score=51.59 TRINITY_DN61845_c0_g1_i1:69-1103(-)